MLVFSKAFHTSYQYSLATALGDVDWFFVDGKWHTNRPKPHNVHDFQDRPLADYDVFLAHHPEEFSWLKNLLIEHGINPKRLIYISHWGSPAEELWKHKYFGKSKEQFVKDVSEHAIVSVSHFILHDFKFYSHVINEAIPHYVPWELYADAKWEPADDSYINIVVGFFQQLRGAGSDFWLSLNDVPKKIYGPENGELSAGSLETTDDLKAVATRAKGYLWTGDYVAMSFAPLECMACGCPMIAPNNMDWPKFFTDRQDIMLYRHRDQQSLYDTLKAYESSPALRRRLSENGRRIIQERFGAEQFRKRWSRVLDAALTAK